MTPELPNSDIIQLMRSILRDSYSDYQVARITVEEDLSREETRVTCEVARSDSDDRFSISGLGAGVVDALFNGMMERFADEYPSLKSIKLNKFSVTPRLETKNKEAGTDSQGECSMELVNSEGKRFPFSHASRSVLGAVLCTTLNGMAYFINSERAFTAVYHALQDAKERNRQDLVQKYTGQMAILVRNTSYSEVIKKIQDELG